MEEKLINCFKEFQLIDLLGFGTLLKVQEINNFDEYVMRIVQAFSKEKRKKRKQLLQLAQDIVGNNREYDRKNKVKEDGV